MHRERKRRVRYKIVNLKTYANRRFYAKSEPYPNPTESIDTGLSKQWRYSPRFCSYEADVYIELTGKRYKDYRIAEELSGKIHIPRETVWHHVWNEENGKTEMQLVDFSLHKKAVRMPEGANSGRFIILENVMPVG